MAWDMICYTMAHFEQVARTGACNGRHPIDQRLSRWLLMAHDRVEGDEFPMTHEYLSMMLGVRRAGITVAAGQLQKAGYLRYERGRMASRPARPCQPGRARGGTGRHSQSQRQYGFPVATAAPSRRS